MTAIELLDGLIELDGALGRAAKLLIGIHVFLPHCMHGCIVPTALFLESNQGLRARIDLRHWEKVWPRWLIA
jgi:hypothetical protein